jgi:hypothetical protein
MKNEMKGSARAAMAKAGIQRNTSIHPYLKGLKDSCGPKEASAPMTAKATLVKDMK